MPLPLAILAAAAGANVLGAGLQAFGNYKAGKAAASAQKSAATANRKYAADVLKQQQELEANAGYGKTGSNALSNLNSLINSGELYKGYGDYNGQLGFDASSVDVTQDPGYAFRLAQGQQALDAGAGAKGQLFSGAQQKALLKYGQDLGSQEYQNAYNRQFTTFQDARNAKYQDYVNRVQQYNQNLRNQVSDLGNLANYGENSLVRQQNALNNSVASVTGANNAIGNANATQAGAGWSALSSGGASLSGGMLDLAKLYAMQKGTDTGNSLYGTDTGNSTSIYGT